MQRRTDLPSPFDQLLTSRKRGQRRVHYSSKKNIPTVFNNKFLQVCLSLQDNNNYFFYFNLSSQKLSNSIHHKNSFCCPVDWVWILGRVEVEQVCLPILCQTEKVADKDVRAKYAHANCLQAIKASRKNWQIAKNRLNGNAPSSNQIVEQIFLRAQHK